jgi:hypothetical protein
MLLKGFPQTQLVRACTSGLMRTPYIGRAIPPLALVALLLFATCGFASKSMKQVCAPNGSVYQLFKGLNIPASYQHAILFGCTTKRGTKSQLCTSSQQDQV